MTIERGYPAYDLALTRSGGSVRIDENGELYAPSLTGEVRARLASLSPEEALELELSGRARVLASLAATDQAAGICAIHGFSHSPDDARYRALDWSAAYDPSFDTEGGD
jgi:hypothetical protein